MLNFAQYPFALSNPYIANTNMLLQAQLLNKTLLANQLLSSQLRLLANNAELLYRNQLLTSSSQTHSPSPVSPPKQEETQTPQQQEEKSPSQVSEPLKTRSAGSHTRVVDSSLPEMPKCFEKELQSLAIQYKKDWKKIAIRFVALTGKNYTAYDLRRIYKSISQAPSRKIKFTDQEDLDLVNSISELGLNWVKISEKFQGRCPLSLRNRYYSLKRQGKIDSMDLNEEEGFSAEEPSKEEDENRSETVKSDDE